MPSARATTPSGLSPTGFVQASYPYRGEALMTVRKLRSKQGFGCSWCDKRATHRGFMYGKKACADHMEQLRDWDRRAQAPDYSEAAFYAGLQP